ncbi:hypothetical protein T05_12124 [Trichinella murrelli]|uniref:Uncharacterized protein n=1 Tax=Trichinella murrelli TaxID=144512 RepID=A0A0V0U4T2_9BILA|nr:hypothetical protein T05_12124 [Trichinella murrelli]
MGNKRDQNQPESSDESEQGSVSLLFARETGTRHDPLAEGLSAGTSFRCQPGSQFWNDETGAISRPNQAVISVQVQDSDSKMRQSSQLNRQKPHGISFPEPPWYTAWCGKYHVLPMGPLSPGTSSAQP